MLGVGLLAKAVSQSMNMLDVLASSRSKPTPTEGLCWAWMLCPLKIECGSEPARDAVVAVTRPRSFYQA